MTARGKVHDYAGEELRAGDLVAYAARQGNRVRMSDGIVLGAATKSIAGRLLPVLRIQPTGTDSGWGMGARKSLRPVDIFAEHVRLITPGFAPPEG